MSRYAVRTAFAIATTLAAMGSARPCAAQQSEASLGAARTLGYEGVEAYQKGDYVVAADKLDRAYRVVKAPSLGLWSARAFEKLGRMVEAAERYLEVTRLDVTGGELAVQQQAKADAAKEREALLPRIPHVVIQIEGAKADDVVVTLDGVQLPSALIGAKCPVNPGRHRLRGELKGKHHELEISISESETKSVTLGIESAGARAQTPLALEPPPDPNLASATPRAENDASRDGSPQKTVGWIALGAGAVGIGIGTVTGILAISKKTSIEDSCPNERCAPPVHDDADAYNSLRTVSTVGFIAGLVGVGIGTTMLITAPSKPTRSARVSAWVGIGAVGVNGAFQ